MSIYGRLLLDRNQNEDEVEEHITIKREVNIQMISTLKNEKSISSINPGAQFETSMT